MSILSNKLKPFQGLRDISLYSNINDVKEFLKRGNETFHIEIWPNKGCTPEVPWTLIKISNSITLFFANNKLWKIYVENKFEGKLSNGICLGMTMDEAKLIDNSLRYDEWNEDYSSNQGYWLEEEIDTGKIVSISIFIKEVLNEEVFDEYKW